ncbi:hypothetical protein [uncultured Actinomyces sp.]|uniref:hypothetical protein n=1 Tax=uncultured Actinomyces sp. TaxID=249061 RepID=UPI0028D74650|nr:hypothetical protein [uncultured Actinomyces sp.]
MAKRHGKPLILVFGEGGKGGGGKHTYDATAIKSLLPALNRSIDQAYDIKIRKDPPSLTRGASTGAVLSWMESLRSVIDAQDALRPVHAVIVHQDADKEDPRLEGHTQLLKNLESMRAKKGRPKRAGTWKVFAVTPVRMTEAWWLLFPEAVKTLAPGAWRDLKFAQKPVESHQDPAGYLTSLTDRHTNGKRKYSKSDSPTIARKLAERIIVGQEPAKPDNPASASWNQFVDDARSM